MPAESLIQKEASPTAGAGRKYLRLLYAHNPFYLISVCFVLHGTGLWYRESQPQASPWPLMGLICGYITMMALTALIIVHCGKVWQDARSIFLILIALFVELALTFDDVLISSPTTGRLLLLAGLALSIVVTEGLLLGLHIRLPLLLRGPFHLLLALMFLYPLVLVTDGYPHDTERVSWVIFLFSPIAALVLLSLLPAVWYGPHYVKNNGTPWVWPWFPWVPFGFLGVAVCVRAYALSLSFDPVMSLMWEEALQLQSAFGAYFLIPILLAASVLLLEIGIVARHRATTTVGLAVTLVCLLLSFPGLQQGKPYHEFLDLFSLKFGSPVAVTLLAALLVFGYAAVRRIELARALFPLLLLLATVVDRSTVSLATVVAPQSWPLWLLATIEILIGLRYRNSRRFLLGAVCLAAALRIDFGAGLPELQREFLTWHYIGVAAIATGFSFRDDFARLLQAFGVLLIVAACTFATLAPISAKLDLAAWQAPAYQSGLVLLALVVAYLARNVAYFYAGLVGLGISLSGWCWQAYVRLKNLTAISGLESITIGFIWFLLAAGISAYKAGFWQRLLAALPHPPRPVDPDITTEPPKCGFS